ncbi:MAG: glycosyltransferase [Clostridia bacterium]|nr:glycosyltransferase [Clostridia bacterium]
MAKLLKGMPAAGELCKITETKTTVLRARGVNPLLTILRVGRREDDLLYEYNAVKRCSALGIRTRIVALGEGDGQAELMDAIDEQNRDDSVHGILMLRPLPKDFDEAAACAAIAPDKDVDGVTPASQSGVFAGTDKGFAPCTARACLELLKYYGITLAGKRVAVIGRSLNVGRPAAMMLMRENATVTLCHSRTEDLPSVVRNADIVVAAAGQAGLLGADCFAPDQIVVDVGANWDGDAGKFTGDVNFAAAEKTVAAITPVPGGVGAVTTAVLAMQVTEAAARQEEARGKDCRLKIGIFIDTYFPMIDGVIMAVDNYAKYLTQYADVTIFTTVVNRDFEDDSPYRVVRCRSLPLRSEDYVVPAPDLDLEFWNELMRSELDIVHIHSPFTVGMAGKRYAKRHGIPMVATMHSQFQVDFRRTLKMEPLVKLAMEEIMKVFNSADEVWVPNANAAKVFISYGGEKVPVIRGNATDLRPVQDPEASRARINALCGLGDDEKVFLFVGRMVLQKNIMFIAEAAAELKKRDAMPFKVLYVGSGPDEEELKKHVAELGIADSVVFCGKISDRGTLADFYARADLFVFPSFYDVNSLVQIEAASQRTPTLFLSGAVTAAMGTDGTDCYFSENSAEKYAEKIVEIFEDREKYGTVCEGAFRNIYRSWDVVIAGILSDYRRLIKEHHRRT